MSETTLRYCATDKEIYDVLMSSRQRITESVMLGLAKDRGIFYSPKESREQLAHNLSMLPQDYNDLNTILDQREPSSRAEKVTSVILNTPLTIDDIKEVLNDYKEDTPADEKVITHPSGTERYTMTVHYSEIDYSKTRLVQRRAKEADIEFIVEADKTVVRMPASTKAREVVQNLKNRLDGKKKADIPTDLIELTEFKNPEARTEFFISLIDKLHGFKLDNVTSLKVESSIKDNDENEFDLEDDQEVEQAKQEMLAVVKDVALRGQSLLASTEYQQLRAKGFYITSIIWRSRQLERPFPIVECEAGFEDPEDGKGFRYNVRGALHFKSGNYTRTLRPISQDDRQRLLSLIEQTAHNSLWGLRRKTVESAPAKQAEGGNT